MVHSLKPRVAGSDDYLKVVIPAFFKKRGDSEQVTFSRYCYENTAINFLCFGYLQFQVGITYSQRSYNILLTRRRPPLAL